MRGASISVAMATYNGERFLQEQLDSLARQTLLPYELVACDDGSADGTLDILHQFAAKAPFPVRIYENENRLGYGFNFLGALGRCTGDLLAFCDQDDVWLEKKLSVCAEKMHDPDVAMVTHSALVFSEQPLPGRMRHPDHRSSMIRRCGELPVHKPIPGFSMVLRATVLRRVPPPPYSAPVARWAVHDSWAVAAALSCGRVVLLSDRLALYRLHERNVSLSGPRAGLGRLAPEPSFLEHSAEVKYGVAGFLNYAASFCDERARGTLHEYAQRLEGTGEIYHNRAALHRVCGRRLEAFRAFATMFVKGNYSPRALGAKAFGRDLVLAALGPMWRENGI